MQSKTGLLLPLVFRGNEQLEGFLTASEEDTYSLLKELESFLPKLLPGSSPEEWLRWLFYALGAEDYYREDFTRTDKRRILENIFELYKYKGTVKGLELHLRLLINRELYKATQPPDKCFLSPSYTNEERRQFEALMPEIRVFPFKKNSQGPTFFLGDFPNADFPDTTNAILRIGDVVELYDPLTGQSTPLNTYTLEKEYVHRKLRKEVQIRKKSKAHGVLPEDFLSGFIVNQKAGERLYTLVLEQPYTEEIERRRWLSVQPSLTPVRTTYEEERVSGQATGFYLFNKYMDIYEDRGGSFLGEVPVSSDAEERIFKKLKLFDPDRASPVVNSSFRFLGATRVSSLKEFTMEAYVNATDFQKAMHITTPLWGFASSSDANERIEDILWAADKNRPAGVKTLVSVTNHRPVRVGEFQLNRNKLGEYILGVI